MRADDQDKSAPPPAHVPRLADKMFLGAEFLTWVYFTLIENGFNLDVGDALPVDARPVDNEVQFAIGKRVLLVQVDGTGAKVTLAGTGLDNSGELLQAVSRGALIDALAIDIAISQRVYSLRLRADDGGIQALKLPDLLSEQDDEDDPMRDPLSPPKRKRRPRLPLEDVLSLRMTCAEEVEAILDALFNRFITRRLARAWQAEDIAAIRGAVAEGLQARLPTKGA
jgi:hypothetical protein